MEGLLCIRSNEKKKIMFKFAADGGKELESELNKKGPGTCLFILCDMSKEEDIKVLNISPNAFYYYHPTNAHYNVISRFRSRQSPDTCHSALSLINEID